MVLNNKGTEQMNLNKILKVKGSVARGSKNTAPRKYSCDHM